MTRHFLTGAELERGELTALIDRPDVDGANFNPDRVDYGPVIQFKLRILDRAWQNFKAGRTRKPVR